MENNNVGNLDQKVENIMVSKIQLIFGILFFMVPIIGFFFKIQLDISLIRTNHEAHMQAALEKIVNLEKEEQQINQRLETQNTAIIQLLTVHPEIKLLK